MATFEEFLNERNITLKRRYTEAHPAQTVGNSARVRNAIIEALKDGKITVEEFNNIVSQHSSAPSKWTRGNKRFFKIEEDGVSLSKYGTKILTSLVTESKVTEAMIVMDAMDPKSKGLAKLLKKNNVKMKILTMRGPSGLPEVKLTGKREDLEIVLADGEYGWDDPELTEYIEESNEVNEGLNKSDVAYQLAIDYTGRTKPKITKLNKKRLEIKYGYKISPETVIDSIKKVHPEIELKHVEWSDKMSGGGFHIFDILESAINNIEENMIHNNFNEFINKSINENNVQDLDMEDMNPKMAKQLLSMASKQYKNEFQGSYTVDKGNKKMRFDTYSALLAMVKQKDSGPYGPSYGINIGGNNELEDFEGNVLGKLNDKSLSSAISSVVKAMKIAAKNSNESVVTEAKVSAKKLLKSVVNGESNSVEGIKLSKEMAQSFLDWLDQSSYGRKFSDLPFDKLFSAAFNWGIERYAKDNKLKNELKDLKAKAKAMKESTVYTNFQQFVNESVELNEALKSSKLRGLLTMKRGSKQILKAIYGFSKIELDKITDDQIIDIDPKLGKKAEGLVVYYTTQEKDNPYADTSKSVHNSANRIPANTILALGMGKDVAYIKRDYIKRKMTMSLTTDPRKSSHDIGINKEYRGWDASGIYNVKRVIDVADAAFVINTNALPNAKGKIEDRIKAKEGALAFKSDKEFKDANIARYREILQKRASELPIDKLIEDAIDDATKVMKDGLKNQEKNKYGELIAGVGKDGRAYKLNDISNFINGLISDYERWSGYMATIEEAEAKYGKDSKEFEWEARYSQKESEEYAKRIKDKLAKLKKRNLAW